MQSIEDGHSEATPPREQDGDAIAQRPDAVGLFVALAPMDGVTDWVYREFITELFGKRSGISMCVSEFVRVTDHRVPDHVLLRSCPELAHGSATASGTPVHVQILGGDAQPMAETANAAASLGAAGIDINFGCPAKTVNNHDGGATLLKMPNRLERIVAAVRRAVPDGTPVSAKIRLGWDCAGGVDVIARAIEAGGAQWLTVHGRTRTQLYRPPIDWVGIGRARASVSIPVVANGDLNSVADLRACAEQSGCVAFMIGRGAMARPQLFREFRKWPSPPSDAGWISGLVRSYAQRLLAAGAPERSALGRAKQWLRLAAGASPELHETFSRCKRAGRLEDLSTLLDQRASPEVDFERPAPHRA
jgi:tRNA-dihydrouridine synthase C